MLLYSVELIFSNFNLIQRFIREDVGSCTQVYDVYLAFIKYQCNETLDPYNSIWSGSGMALVVFFPLACCAWYVEAIFRQRYPMINSTKNSIDHANIYIEKEQRS